MSSSSDANKWFLRNSCFVTLSLEISFINMFGFNNQHAHTQRYDMEQSAGYSKNPWNNNPFWEKASAEPPLEWSKRVAILEMAVFANDEIEVRNLLRANQPLIEPAEPNYEVKLTGETGAQKKNREVRNQEKQVGWENRVRKARGKGVLYNSFCWDEADAKVHSYFFYASTQRGNDRFNKGDQTSTYTPSPQKTL